MASIGLTCQRAWTEAGSGFFGECQGAISDRYLKLVVVGHLAWIYILCLLSPIE